MALQSSDQYGGLDPSSRALMEKLDKLLVDCTPKEVAEDSIYGVDYMVGLEELKKVASYLLNNVYHSGPCSSLYLRTCDVYLILLLDIRRVRSKVPRATAIIKNTSNRVYHS